jgi:hypothetical protein
MKNSKQTIGTTRPFSELVTEVKKTWSDDVIKFHEQAEKFFAHESEKITKSIRDSRSS